MDIGVGVFIVILLSIGYFIGRVHTQRKARKEAQEQLATIFMLCINQFDIAMHARTVGLSYSTLILQTGNIDKRQALEQLLPENTEWLELSNNSVQNALDNISNANLLYRKIGLPDKSYSYIKEQLNRIDRVTD